MDLGQHAASGFLEVAVTKRWHAWLVAIASFFPILILAALAQDSAGSDLELLHPCRVVIRRSRDGHTLAEYRHFRLGPAAQHCEAIGQKVNTSTLAAVCAEYEIAIGEVI